MLYGRTSERAEIDQLLRRAHRGRSGVLIVRGDAGIGKTSLLEYAARSATGMRVLRGTGIESEAELPFAYLHLVLHRDLDRLDSVPLVQAEALRAALGQRSAPTDDRFLVGQAVLSLLAELADDVPVLCLVDDAHWVDRASIEALLFAARRVEAEGIAILLAGRDDLADDIAADLPEVRLAGLDREESLALVSDTAADLAPRAKEWVVDEAAGHPLALIELPQLLSPDQRAGELPAHGLPVGAGTSISRVQQSFADRFSALPAKTQYFVLVAAAEDTGELAVVLAAAEGFGATLQDIEPAEQAGLLSIQGQAVRFRHPLCRAAVYRSATTARRVAVHRSLALALAGPEAADRRAWHLAAAATEPDECVAQELEEAAKRAAQRGGRIAVAAAYERAAQLSPERSARGRRLTAAATAAADGGLADRATLLADRAAALVSDPVQLAKLAHVQASLAQMRGRHRLACDLLLAAAQDVGADAPDAAARLLFSAMSAAWLACDLSAMEAATRLIESMNLTERAKVLPVAKALRGVADIAEGRPESGVPLLHDLLAMVHEQPQGLGLRERARVGLYLLTGDIETGHQVALALEHDCRTRGAIGVLPDALLFLAKSQLLTGHHRDAVANATEGLRIARDTGQRHSIGPLTAILAYVAAVEGQAHPCNEYVETIKRESPDPVDLWSPSLLGLLELGLGRYESAYGRLEGQIQSSNLMTLPNLPILVEVAVALGERGCAQIACDEFAAWAVATGEPWPLAVMMRCRALVGSDHEVERSFSEAVALHQGGAHPFEHARTRLLFGEWLRRQRRRSDARGHLRAALELFDLLDARPWAGRARTELRAAGEAESVPAPRIDPLRRLTPQELQVARLAAQGLSNPAIGARLFLSPRTVAYHLYKAYPKLGVANRAQLTLLLAQNP
ncbi:ATP-binding protein [Kribbella sp. NPDC050241]|uniref:ATP-binding protein n=1 Tax=Kribbella sp. NPDC050241 TaxID=3364115 RepID=UPI0037B305CC